LSLDLIEPEEVRNESVDLVVMFADKN